MPKLSISEKILLGETVEKVYASIHDFREWKEWSPWLICEEDCALEYGDGSQSWYSWDGKYVGAGKMSLLRVVENERFEYFLEFLKPWKSKADVQFNLTETVEGTEVEWVMESSLPWFMWWMKPMMLRMISMDYQRGLKMMKEYLEAGSVGSVLEYSDGEVFPARAYVGVRSVCGMDEVERCMGEDFEKLRGAVEERGIGVTEFFTIYERWNLGKGDVAYTVCAGVDDEVVGLPDEFVLGLREACEGFVVTHTGEYHHLGNAWSAGMVRARSRPPVFKQSKRQMPFEIYVTLPGSGEEVITKVVMPKV